MPFDGRVSLVRWALRGSAVAGAVGEALRRAEMREPKCALNLPNIIGQTPTVPSRESGPKRHRPPIAATEQSASPSLWQEAGYRCFHWAHIFNRSFRNDVNARVIAFGERTAIKVSSLACKLGHPMDQVPVQPACMGRSIQMTGNLVSCRRLLDERRLGGATGHRKGTARVETAAGRRRQGAGDLAFDRDALPLVVGMGRQGRG